MLVGVRPKVEPTRGHRFIGQPHVGITDHGTGKMLVLLVNQHVSRFYRIRLFFDIFRLVDITGGPGRYGRGHVLRVSGIGEQVVGIVQADKTLGVLRAAIDFFCLANRHRRIHR